MILTLSFAEDVGDGDHTTLSTVPADEMGKQRLANKRAGSACPELRLHEKYLKIRSVIEDDRIHRGRSTVKTGRHSI